MEIEYIRSLKNDNRNNNYFDFIVFRQNKNSTMGWEKFVSFSKNLKPNATSREKLTAEE